MGKIKGMDKEERVIQTRIFFSYRSILKRMKEAKTPCDIIYVANMADIEYKSFDLNEIKSFTITYCKDVLKSMERDYPVFYGSLMKGRKDI